VVTNYTGTGIGAPTSITTGPDGALWFTNSGEPGSIGRITDLPPPDITSSNNASVTVGSSLAFIVTTSGTPKASVSEKGPLPVGVKFVNRHDGTAKISGKPKRSGAGVYDVTITATFGTGKKKVAVSQAFTLTVYLPG
jgi:hypothetical protein